MDTPRAEPWPEERLLRMLSGNNTGHVLTHLNICYRNLESLAWTDRGSSEAKRWVTRANNILETLVEAAGGRFGLGDSDPEQEAEMDAALVADIQRSVGCSSCGYFSWG